MTLIVAAYLIGVIVRPGNLGYLCLQETAESRQDQGRRFIITAK